MKNFIKKTTTKINETPLNVWFAGFVALSVLFLVLMNLFASRPIGIGSLQITNAGLLLIAPALVLQNVITEVWGKKTAFKVTVFAIACQVFIVLLISLILVLPTNDGSVGLSENWANAFGPQWRIVTASIIAFAAGSILNIFIFAKIRDKSKNVQGKYKWLYVLAAVISTIIAQVIDSTLFMVLAFAEVGISNTIELPWIHIWTQIGIGTAAQILLETTIVALAAVHLAKWLKRKKNFEHVKSLSLLSEEYPEKI